ncbi:mannose-6-phosphate isomerase [Candidatus Kaiserbacteria bacterium RIFCSPHIGHO2_01_FULL_48_10]|uniref:Mannose-6-phosphate isomerase n=1 Tax=Candidatus Kaiserbacteria bacterium RIFCSPHIGHO2_01_FULL_48_10 TaxID=1798476 RepID=A0A1F6C470_9BACT|nr:MAG: mannose-6-phosphate isomerase [Candidatus Kaiserbacteria bacterium RIFCSPHIGHO2_01_FULL_48_10]
MEGLPNYLREERPWGSFERFTLNEPTTVKIIVVNLNEAFSLQTHEHRDEYWRVLKGSGTFTIGDEEKSAAAGESYYVPQGTEHRATAGPEGLVLLEIAFGDFDESDIKRIEDKYGRA